MGISLGSSSMSLASMRDSVFSGLLYLSFLNRRLSMEVKASPPKSIKRVKTTIWELEKFSSSTLLSPDTVNADADIYNISTYLGLKEGLLGFSVIMAREPNKHRETK